MTLDDALDKIDGLESDIHAIVEAIAARSAHRRGDMDSLFEFVAANYPKLWERFNGNPRYPFTTGERSDG